MTPIQQTHNQQQTTPQAAGQQFPVLRLRSPATNTMGQGPQQPLARCLSAPTNMDYSMNTPNVPTPQSAGSFNMGSVSMNTSEQTVPAPASNEALNQFFQNTEEELNASRVRQ